jgi:hypothetical protein
MASRTNAKAVVEIYAASNAGYLKLTNNRDKTMTFLQGSGSNLFAYDKLGMLVATLASRQFGGFLELNGTIKGSKAKASIGIGSLRGNGLVTVTDSSGQKTARLEPGPQKKQS